MMRRFSFSHHGIPAMAVAMMGFAVWAVVANYTARAVTTPPIAAPANPYQSGVAAVGLIEPASEVIALAIERGGVVMQVNVVAGRQVRAGEALFAIDDRNYKARVAETEAAVGAVEADIRAIEASILLQQDTIAQSQANLSNAAAEYTRASLDYERYVMLSRNGGASHQRFETADADLRKADAARAAATAALAAAKRQSDVLNATRMQAEARLIQAKAVLEQARVDLDKTIVCAPVDGTILKVNVRLGEYAAAGILAPPLMTMGSTQRLHVRVDIAEVDAWRIHPDEPAIAMLRGNPAISTRLAFVRFEPYVLPKKSLTGDTTERVDTRVLQAIYAYAPGDFPAFIGQQVDVFIEAREHPDIAPPMTARAIR
jgi:HlyD family secretion protein